ncbi:putative ORFan [Tupanvirus deep ocean]|uniref:ORFan n=2 Tax=Tupanvirus TaxID=2094720 RepID=A0AC62AA76_9VIRU|nr:putative ORFan [Tupanvirus deep ocean]QKU34578.1 putative ORFan [Tupanvirus deep ocean]
MNAVMPMLKETFALVAEPLPVITSTNPIAVSNVGIFILITLDVIFK